METFTARQARNLPANGRNIVSRLHLLLAEAAVELPGYRFQVVHFAKGVDQAKAVITTPVNHKDRARPWFNALAPLLPWACVMELDQGRGTITIKPKPVEEP